LWLLYGGANLTSVSGDQMDAIHVIAKEDMIEDVPAVYGDCAAKQVKRSRAVTLVEIVIVDAYGNERLLDIITRTK
jgi:hypothetical protein